MVGPCCLGKGVGQDLALHGFAHVVQTAKKVGCQILIATAGATNGLSP